MVVSLTPVDDKVVDGFCRPDVVGKLTELLSTSESSNSP
jgi:hypothetical protein